MVSPKVAAEFRAALDEIDRASNALTRAKQRLDRAKRLAWEEEAFKQETPRDAAGGG